MRNVAFDHMQQSSATGSTDNERFALSSVCLYVHMRCFLPGYVEHQVT
jgi:hypothetical protein